MNKNTIKNTKVSADQNLRALPAYEVIFADGTSYITSMSKTTTLDKARAYFLDASIEQPDGSCKRVSDVKLANGLGDFFSRVEYPPAAPQPAKAAQNKDALDLILNGSTLPVINAPKTAAPRYGMTSPSVNKAIAELERVKAQRDGLLAALKATLRGSLAYALTHGGSERDTRFWFDNRCPWAIEAEAAIAAAEGRAS